MKEESKNEKWREIVDEYNKVAMKMAKLAGFKDYYHKNYDNTDTLTKTK